MVYSTTELTCDSSGRVLPNLETPEQDSEKASVLLPLLGRRGNGSISQRSKGRTRSIKTIEQNLVKQ